MKNASKRRHSRTVLVLAAVLAPLAGACQQQAASDGTAQSEVSVGQQDAAGSESVSSTQDFQLPAFAEAAPLAAVPEWTVDAVFYQIFPERFRNGDPSNDPTRESLEFPDNVSEAWAISSWTGDWYARAPWERERGNHFFDDGVFDRRYGGDLQGVIDKLDYLQDLGVNTLYFNPVFYGRSLHKYDGSSMHHIDPYFGPDPDGDLELMATETGDSATWKWTAADRLFLDLIEQLHERDMRIVIDGVFNHTGRDFFAFADVRKQQQKSPYRDWYIIQQFDNPDTPTNEFRYKGWWGVDTLPEFADNQAGDDLHTGPKQYVMDITRRWMDPDGDGDPSDGIDGWRLDVANEVPSKFWKSWNETVRELNPHAYTVAEIWDDASEFLVTRGFSATMNYHAFAFLVKGFLVDGRLSAYDFGRELHLRRQLLPAAMGFAMQNLVDSHDTPRVASMIVNRKHRPYLQPDRFDYDVGERSSPRWWDQYDVQGPTAEDRKIQKLVALMQMTYVGAPMIYYGTEAGMWGSDDPCDRMPMVWPDLVYEDQASDPNGRSRSADPVSFDRDMHDFYRAAIGLRHDRPALRRGSARVAATDDAGKFIALERVSGNEQILIALNRGNAPFAFDLPNGSWVVALTTSAAEDVDWLAHSQRGQTLHLPPLEGAVLIFAHQDSSE